MDTPTFAELHDKLEPGAYERLRRKHKSLPRDEHDDVVQEAFIALARVLERTDVAEPGAMLSTILDRRVVDKIRALEGRSKREEPTAPHKLRDLGAVAMQPALGTDEHLFGVDFDAAVRGLPETLRETYILTELRGLASEEAARVLSLPLTTVKWRATQARKAMRKELS